MFGAKKAAQAAKLLHINFSAEAVTEKNYTSLKEYCHLTFDQDGWIQHVVVDASGVKFTKSSEIVEPQVIVVSNPLSGLTKGAEILIPENCSFNLL